MKEETMWAGLLCVACWVAVTQVHGQVPDVAILAGSTAGKYTTPPSIYVEPSQLMIFKPRESISLPCIADGNPAPEYIWYKDGDVKTIGTDTRYTLIPGIGTLVISSPEKKDEGYWQCSATNPHGTSLAQKVEIKEAILSSFDRVLTAVVHKPLIGAYLTLKCTPPTSYPQAQISWVLLDAASSQGFEFVTLDSRVSMDYDGNLHFVYVTNEDRRDDRTYSCQSFNTILRTFVQGEDQKISPQGSVKPCSTTIQPNFITSTPTKSKPQNLVSQLEESFLEDCSEFSSYNLADDYNDETYELSRSTDSCSSSDDEEVEDSFISPEQDSKFVIFEKELKELFVKCHVQDCSAPTDDVVLKTSGSLLLVTATCLNNHIYSWKSQPVSNRVSLGNLLVCGAILFTGNTYTTFREMADSMKLQTISESEFYKIQRRHLLPTINKMWQSHSSELLDNYKDDEDLVVAGDGRCDSPGHCASFGTYTLMDTKTNAILTTSVVKVTEVKNSYWMEKEGLVRGLKTLEDAGVTVKTLATDRHPQITKFMREDHPNISHQFDVWHLAKSVTKKLNNAAKRKECRDLGPWVQSIVRHLWYCAETCDGNLQLLKEKWHSILRHIVDKHEWTCAEIYTACDHAPLTREERRLKMWLKPGSASHKALQKIVLDKTLTKDLAQITEFRHTGDLEVFHNSMLKYMPKRVSFSYEGMVARTMLAALDNNTNVGREQAETLTGEKRWKLQWSKAAQDFVVKKISNPKDFTFRDDLMSSLVDRQRQRENSILRSAPRAQYKSPYDTFLLRGQDLRMKCIFSGYPTPTITWSRTDGKPMSPRKEDKSFGQELFIPKVEFSDEGNYACSALNEETDTPIIETFRVEVQSRPYWITEGPKDINAAEGETAEFTCEAAGRKTPEVKWFVNGIDVRSLPDPRRTVKGNTITFTNLTASDAKVVQCNCSNDNGYIWGDAYLNVLATPPVFQKVPILNLKAAAGQKRTVILPCEVFGAPKPIVTWKKDLVEISTGAKYTILDSGSLLIHSLQATDTGTYQCTGKNKFGTTGKNEGVGSLIVRQPTRLLKKPQDQQRRVGAETKFVCTATTDPEEMNNLKIYWMKDEERIDYDQAQRLFYNELDNSLILSGTTLLDAGKYTCVADNGLNSDNASATLIVIAPPEPPIDIRIRECQSDNARIRWTPGPNNFAQILEFRVEFNTSFTQANWVSAVDVGGELTEAIVPLSPWANYTFRVKARNRAGWSLPSEHTTKVCKTPERFPDHNPKNVRTENNEKNSLLVKWTPMPRIEQNGQGFHYIITYRRLDYLLEPEESIRIDNWQQDEYKILNTPVYKPYRIKVQAVNARGAAPDELPIVGYSSEGDPSVAPAKFQIDPDKPMTSTEAHFRWEAVNKDPAIINGYFRGYQIQFWIEEEDISLPSGIRRTMRTHDIFMTSLEDEGNAWKEKIERGEVDRKKRQAVQWEYGSITNLPSYTEIRAQVVVRNKRFAGPPSNQITFTTPEGVPGQVANFRFLNIGPNHVQLGWSTPTEVNGILTGFDIGYRRVKGLNLDQIQYRNPQIDDPSRREARIYGLQAETRYRVYIWARTRNGRGVVDFLDVSTKSATNPGKPVFTVQAGETTMNVSWTPDPYNPGGVFYVQYKKKEWTQYESTPFEVENRWKYITELESGTLYEVRVMARNGPNSETSSDIQDVETGGSALIIGSISGAGWFIGMIVALLILILLLIIVCIIKRNRGGKYPVQEKEQLRGRDLDHQHEGGFGEYARGSQGSFDDEKPYDDKDDDSYTDSMEEYTDTDPGKFNEDGSFIGQYGKKPPPDSGDPASPSALSTFV